MKFEVWFKTNMSGKYRIEYLDNNGKGFAREDADGIATQLKQHEDVLPDSVEVIRFRVAS